MFLKAAARVVIIGMGNELRGDDAVGLQVIRLLKPYENDRLTVFEGHMMPETFVAPACAKKPTHLLIVDAAELGGPPGTWRLLTSDELDESIFTTHSIPTTAMATEIQHRCGSQVMFLGIQPKQREITLSLSKECQQAARDIVRSLQHSLHLQ